MPALYHDGNQNTDASFGARSRAQRDLDHLVTEVLDTFGLPPDMRPHLLENGSEICGLLLEKQRAMAAAVKKAAEMNRVQGRLPFAVSIDVVEGCGDQCILLLAFNFGEEFSKARVLGSCSVNSDEEYSSKEIHWEEGFAKNELHTTLLITKPADVTVCLAVDINSKPIWQNSYKTEVLRDGSLGIRPRLFWGAGTPGGNSFAAKTFVCCALANDLERLKTREGVSTTEREFEGIVERCKKATDDLGERTPEKLRQLQSDSEIIVRCADAVLKEPGVAFSSTEMARLLILLSKFIETDYDEKNEFGIALS